ncbi:MAG TPA: CAP domain-containing protein [Candidatus Paceibacterota bacterium]|nr:CAP domain-containing protein [Candidatus Paceibacterota bacterium]
MLTWLKQHFIPHEGNDHRPHILRTPGAQLLLFLLLASQAFFLLYSFIILPTSKQVAAVLVPILISETNKERTNAHLSVLSKNELLMKSAQLKANDMAAKGYFAHNSPSGDEPWVWFRQVGYDYRFAGENLAVNFVESKDITDAWMNSPTHRDNLLSGKYTQVGIATALGKYKGKDAIFVVQHFGTPLAFAPAPNPRPVAAAIGGLSTAAGEAVRRVEPRVLGAESAGTVETKVSFLEKVKTQPRTLALVIELAIALIASTALLLAFFIKIRVQHPIIIANGLMIVAMTIGLAFMNVLVTRGSI